MAARLPARSSVPGARGSQTAYTREGFPGMLIIAFLPIIIGSLLTLVSSWTGFLEAAFMDMTLTLEKFDYGFGPGACDGEFSECGNATFGSYTSARNLAIVLFVIGLVAVALKDMIKGGFGGGIELEAADDKNLPEMLKFSVLVFAFLFIFPPIWDVAAGSMNNVGVWILNPHYNLAKGGGEYVHGAEGRGEMCATPITYYDLATLAPYARGWDEWAVYRTQTADNGLPVPKSDSDPVMRDVNGEWIGANYHEAENYIIPKGGKDLTVACLHNVDDDSCPWSGESWKPAPPIDLLGFSNDHAWQLGDVLCNPDYRVKYLFRQAIGTTETASVSPGQIVGVVTGSGGEDFLVPILMQFIKGSVTLQVVMVIFMTGVMVDVVTAFALALLPIVPFYRFLPMSKKVNLGDYSGAAFALLGMPLVASLVVVAGTGAVATLAIDTTQDLNQFFTWLAALSVLLLVIGIPSTMVPLIGAGVQQASAAVQTGIQTAQFAAVTMGSAAAGAVGGARAGGRFRRLDAMGTDKMNKAQLADYKQLKDQGYGTMSRARAAMSGGIGAARGQVFDSQGQLTDKFRQAVAPDTSKVTSASVGAFGLDGKNVLGEVSGLSSAMTGAVTKTAESIASAAKKARAPTKDELLKTAEAQKKESVEKKERADRLAQKALKERDSITTGYKPADDMRGQSALERAAREKASAAKKIVADTRQEMQTVTQNRDHMTEQHANTKDELQRKEAELAKAKNNQARLQARVDNGSFDPDKKRVEFAKNEEDLKQGQADIGNAQKEYNGIEDKTSAEAKAAQDKIDKLTEQQRSLEAKNDKILDTLTTLDGTKVAGLEQEIGGLHNGLEKQTAALSRLDSNVDELGNIIAAQTAVMQGANAAAASHAAAAKDLHASLLEEADLVIAGEHTDSTMSMEQAEAIREHHDAKNKADAARNEAKKAEELHTGLKNEKVEADDRVKEDKENKHVKPDDGGKKPPPSGKGRSSDSY